MKVLVLGSGAREHALVWKFSRSARISGLFAAPGNAGTAELATNLGGVDPLSEKDVIKVCRENAITHVFVGPEEPLARGIVDALTDAGIAAIGPHKEAAQLEGSKAFSKAFMLRNKIPTAEYREFSDFEEAREYIAGSKKRIVLKKSGLAAGKGVLESQNVEEMTAFAKKVLKDDVLVIEEFLEGCEATIFAVLDGKNYLLLPPCMDFKKAGENDTGPNTGGMGSVCPVPWLDAAAKERILREAIEPTFEGLRREGLFYRGILYFGLMITPGGPKLLEYNVRFGDPETQSLLPLISSDFGNLCDAITTGSLDSFPLTVSERASVGVVVAAKGYPAAYRKGQPVRIAETPGEKDLEVFHAATYRDSEGILKTGGGRCFTVVGTGKDLFEAADRAYRGVKNVFFPGAWFRPDIGKKFLTE